MRRLIELITFILVIETICVFSASIRKVSVSDKIEELVHEKCPLMKSSPFVGNLEFLELCSDFNQVKNITVHKSMFENFARCHLYYNSLLNLCSLKQLDNTTVHKYFDDTTQIINARNSCDILHNVQNNPTIKLYFGKPEDCDKMCIEPDGSKNKACIWSAYLIEITNLISPATKQPANAVAVPDDITTQSVEAKSVVNISQKVEKLTPTPKTTIEDAKINIKEITEKTPVKHSDVKPVLSDEKAGLNDVKPVLSDEKAGLSDVKPVLIHDETTQQILNKKQPDIEIEALPKSDNKETLPVQTKVVDMPSTSTTVVIEPVNNKPDELSIDKNDYNHGIAPDNENAEDGNVLDDADDEEDELPPIVNNNPSHEKPIVEKSKPLELKEDMDIPTNNAEPIEDDSYFFSYFMMVCIVFIMGYVGYHNKQKILALVLEGRRGKRQHRRRPNSANYHKLDSNLEEAVTSSCNKNTTNVIY